MSGSMKMSGLYMFSPEQWFPQYFQKKYLIKHNQEKYVKNQNASGHKKIFEN